MQCNQPNPVERILRANEVVRRCGISRSSVYAKSKDEADDFPKAVRISERTCGWYESEVQAWIKGRRKTATVDR